MATNKTKQTEQSVTDFIDSVADETKRDDSFQLINLISGSTGLQPKMWGPSIVGFGSYHYTYESGREGDAPIVGFSLRANALTIYLAVYHDWKEDLLQKLGKHKMGKGCLYVKKLSDVDLDILKEMILASVAYLKSKYPTSD